MIWKAGLSFAAYVLLLLATSSIQSLAQEEGEAKPKSTRDGIFSAKQARQGLKLFEMNCLACHQPEEFSEGYLDSWSGQSANDFFEFVRTTMPEDSPGRLKRGEYAAVLAYLFEMNGLPSGELELGSDQAELEQVVIEAPEND